MGTDLIRPKGRFPRLNGVLTKICFSTQYVAHCYLGNWSEWICTAKVISYWFNNEWACEESVEPLGRKSSAEDQSDALCPVLCWLEKWREYCAVVWRSSQNKLTYLHEIIWTDSWLTVQPRTVFTDWTNANQSWYYDQRSRDMRFCVKIWMCTPVQCWDPFRHKIASIVYNSVGFHCDELS